jgi:cell division protease FtsH
VPTLRRPTAPLTIALLAVVLGAVMLVVAVVAGGLGRSAPASVGSSSAGFTLQPTAWTLDRVLAEARQGRLSVVGTMTPPADPATGAQPAPLLVARTVEGTLEPIRLEVPVRDALSAIRAAGFGALLADEAIALGASGAGSGAPMALGLFLSLAILFLLVSILRRSGRLRMPRRLAMGRGRRGDTRRKPSDGVERPTVTLADVAGVDEAKVELTETIMFLRQPQRFTRLGAKAVRGVMLYGPPGTGKTLLAKAVAAEAGVPFYSVSGSEFVEKFVGVGAGRVRELFSQAREGGRGVIFIDEIDALAKARGGTNSHDEREQTLNQLLVEMDGFSTTDELVVIGATNRLDTLDPAVLRPGRFTRKIHVPLPDREGRLAILAVHAADKPLTADVDLPAMARKTYGFSGAQLADLLNEAAILAARAGRDSVTPDDVHAGWLKTALGTSRKRSMDERERSIIAAHEAGHAVCGFLHGDKRRVEEISLFAHGEALGVTVSSSEDNDLPSERDLRARLIGLMGGRVAEELLFAEVTGGASNDFEKATNIASAMVVRYGMGRDPEATDGGVTGRGVLSTLVGARSEGVNSQVRDAQARAIRRILDEAYADARRTLLREMPRLKAVSAYLFEQERIDGETFGALMAGTLTPMDAEGWRAASAAPRPWHAIPQLFIERPTAPPPPSPAIGPGPGSTSGPMHAPPRVASSREAPRPTTPGPMAPPPPAARPLGAPVPVAAAEGRRGARRSFLPIAGRLRRSVAAMVRELATDEP